MILSNNFLILIVLAAWFAARHKLLSLASTSVCEQLVSFDFKKNPTKKFSDIQKIKSNISPRTSGVGGHGGGAVQKIRL